MNADPHPTALAIADLLEAAVLWWRWRITQDAMFSPTEERLVKRVVAWLATQAQAPDTDGNGDRVEACSICGARNVKNDSASYTEAHRAREHRVHDRLGALEERLAALESRSTR